MDGIDAVEDELFLKTVNDDIKQRPNVILKDGFETKELEDGVDIEVKEKYREDDDESEPQQFFDDEESMQQLWKYECIDGATSEADQEKSPFTIKKEKMKAITDDGGVYKLIIKRGTGEVITPGAICRVHYSGYIEYRDEPFDSTRLRSKQLQIRLGESVIRGFDIGIATMRKGEISEFIFSSEYAFKEMGCPPRIPPNTPVLFEIELVSFVDQAASDEFSEFSTEERKKASFENIHEVSQSFRETGNDLFKQNEFFRAIKKYDKGIQLLENCRVQDTREEKKMNEALLALYMNSSLCALKMGQGARAKKYGRMALDIDPKNIKAMFRIAQGFQKEGEFAKAREWYLRAQRQEPNNSEIKLALQKLDQDVERWKMSEKQLYKRMFPEAKPGSPVSSKENIEPDEKPPIAISEEAKSVMMKRLHDFQADDQQNEMTFPASLMMNEVNFLVEEAKKNGLYSVVPTKKVSYLKITKEKPE